MQKMAEGRCARVAPAALAQSPANLRYIVACTPAREPCGDNARIAPERFRGVEPD